MIRRRLVALFAVALLTMGAGGARPAVAHADDNVGGGANTAIAINTNNGSTVFKVAFAIRRVMNSVVDQQNAAVAAASCTDCTTIAIAIEIVLVQTAPTVIAPQNVAIAFNDLCQLCVTVADALQFVVGNGAPVRFDAQGNQILAQIRHELEELRHENLTLAELQAKIEGIRLRIRDVLANHLVPTGKPEENEGPSRSTTTNAGSTPAATTTTSTTSTTPTETSTLPSTTTATTTTGP
jgi:putative peptide zinc metalloprotease protein